MDLPSGYQLVTAASRPDLAVRLVTDDVFHDLWPGWRVGNRPGSRFRPILNTMPSLAPYQFMVLKDTQDDAKIVASAHAVPFFWPELARARSGSSSDTLSVSSFSSDEDEDVFQSLPDGGWSTILTRAILQARARGDEQVTEGLGPVVFDKDELDSADARCTQKPNAMAALSVQVRPEERGANLAEILIKNLKRVGADEGLRYLVVPLRPTRKTEFQAVSMKEYITWKQDVSTYPLNSQSDDLNDLGRKSSVDAVTQHLPFDPWLRKHVRNGARIIKVCPRSYCVEGNAAQWKAWADVDVDDEVEKFMSSGRPMRNNHIDVQMRRALSPLQWDPIEQVGRYIEPNVWICHDL